MDETLACSGLVAWNKDGGHGGQGKGARVCCEGEASVTRVRVAQEDCGMFTLVSGRRLVPRLEARSPGRPGTGGVWGESLDTCVRQDCEHKPLPTEASAQHSYTQEPI